jgi:CTP:molybdopterin cytidylyltransferase MocA
MMVRFGTILAADDILIENNSVYLCELGERPILGILLREMEKSKVKEWSVVLGHDHDLHRRAIEKSPVRCIVDDYWRRGFESQAVRGLKEMPPQADGFIILPADLPFFTSEIMDKMFNALSDELGFIIVAESEGEILPYPLFHRRYLGEVLRRLEMDTFFEMTNDHPLETYHLEIKDKNFLHRVTDEESFKKAQEIFFDIDEGRDLSNPQSAIPQ